MMRTASRFSSARHALAFVLDVEYAFFQLANRFLERGQSFAAKQFGLLRQFCKFATACSP